MIVSQEMITGGDHLLFMQHSPAWRLMRKQLHQDLTESMCNTEHSKIQHAESVQMLHDMMHTPDDWKRHLSRFSNSIVLSIVYGIRTKTIDDPFIKRLDQLLEKWAAINAFGATPPVDIFPFLKLLPQRLFGNWVNRAREVHDEMHILYNNLREAVIRRRATSGSQESIMDRVLDQQDKLKLTEHQVTLLAGVATKGGSDTSAAVLASFILAMVTWPEVLKKAQAEIDTVISADRVPEWSDYEKLPYVASIIKESHRWRPVAPLSVPHALSEDEWIDGKLLSKGTTLFLNVWGLHHDEMRYGSDHDVFNPDHFQGQTLLAAELANSADYEARDHFGYGNGRRICPGIHLADRNLFHAISKLLWAFDVDLATDTITGEPIVPDISIVTGYREGLTASPNDFPVKLTVRSNARKRAIEKAYARAQTDVFPRFEKTDLM
ncbi:hypothetical protein LTR15_012960 [Elasticomyces elasticus]|nr:hypothetical protein LTR15_012960 [Elasticomyces elasticus]